MRCADLVQVFRRPATANAQDQLDLNKRKLRFDRQDHQERMQFAASADVRGGRQRLDLLGRHGRVSTVEIHGVKEMRGCPFDEGIYVAGNRGGWWIFDVLGNGVEYRYGLLGEIG